jgi:hypothetical protein
MGKYLKKSLLKFIKFLNYDYVVIFSKRHSQKSKMLTLRANDLNLNSCGF